MNLSPEFVANTIGASLPPELADFDGDFTYASGSPVTARAGCVHFCTGVRSASLTDLAESGVVAFVAERPLQDRHGKALPTIVHPDPRTAFVELMQAIKKAHPAKTIAVTGSIGKTTAKEMIQLVCSGKFNTQYSRRNANGFAKVGHYIQLLEADTEVLVQETGAAHPGIVEQAAQMLHPDAFVVTNIGLNHVGDYGNSQDALLADKISHDRYLPDDGVAFLNYDDPILRTLDLKHRVISFGMQDTDADYGAENIQERNGVIDFTVIERSTGDKTDAQLHTFGKHNVLNALNAFAVGRWLNIPAKSIVKSLAKYRGASTRQNLITAAGQKVLVDCYNASEIAIASTADALQTIDPGPGGVRVLVVGDIDYKLGDHAEPVHRRVGKHLAHVDGVDHIVCFGPHTRWIADELEAEGKSHFHSDDRDEIHLELRRFLDPVNVLAFKGGQQMALSMVIDKLFGTAFVLEDSDVLRERGSNLTVGNEVYRTIREFGAHLFRLRDKERSGHLHVASEVNGQPVLLIGRYAASGSKVSSLTLPPTLIGIALAAFRGCENLESVRLPDSVLAIGRSTFRDCTGLREVELNEGLQTIGLYAFRNCPNLETLTIPRSVTTIERGAFLDSPKTVFKVYRNSPAAEIMKGRIKSRRYVVLD